MPSLSIDADDGYLEVTVKGAAGAKPATASIDIFEAVNAYSYLHGEHENIVDRGNAWVEWLVGKGLPPLSHGAAFGLAGQMSDMVAEYAKKKPGIVLETVVSPDSTGSASPV